MKDNNNKQKTEAFSSDLACSVDMFQKRGSSEKRETFSYDFINPNHDADYLKYG